MSTCNTLFLHFYNVVNFSSSEWFCGTDTISKFHKRLVLLMIQLSLMGYDPSHFPFSAVFARFLSKIHLKSFPGSKTCSQLRKVQQYHFVKLLTLWYAFTRLLLHSWCKFWPKLKCFLNFMTTEIKLDESYDKTTVLSLSVLLKVQRLIEQ